MSGGCQELCLRWAQARQRRPLVQLEFRLGPRWVEDGERETPERREGGRNSWGLRCQMPRHQLRLTPILGAERILMLNAVFCACSWQILRDVCAGAFAYSLGRSKRPVREAYEPWADIWNGSRGGGGGTYLPT